MNKNDIQASPAQLRYADTLFYGSLIGFVIMLITYIPQGWGWLALIGKGDICNFVGIIILAGLTIVCFAQLALSLARRKQWLLCVIAILEVLVLVLAASGILVGGGH